MQELPQFCQFGRISPSSKTSEGTLVAPVCLPWSTMQHCYVKSLPYFNLKLLNFCPEKFCNIRNPILVLKSLKNLKGKQQQQQQQQQNRTTKDKMKLRIDTDLYILFQN